MTDEQLPIGPGDDASRLPMRQDPRAGQLAAARSNALLTLDLADERKGEDEIDLLAYWRILVKRRWLVLSILAGVVALALLATLMATPIYRATTVLQLEQEGNQVV
ncbi:MAG: hypothetical protein EOP93_14410, partial [Lysobacteraceae bacterium]